MTLAHIAGVPFEEWAAPLAATGTGIVYALRAAFCRLQQRTRKELPMRDRHDRVDRGLGGGSARTSS